MHILLGIWAAINGLSFIVVLIFTAVGNLMGRYHEMMVLGAVAHDRGEALGNHIRKGFWWIYYARLLGAVAAGSSILWLIAIIAVGAATS